MNRSDWFYCGVLCAFGLVAAMQLIGINPSGTKSGNITTVVIAFGALAYAFAKESRDA